MDERPGSDFAGTVAAAVIALAALLALPYILPPVTAAALALVPLVLILWLIVTMLKSIVSKLIR